MRLHYFQHVPFEGLAHIETWAKKKNFFITRTAFYQQEPLPSPEDFDWLVIMGGPMNIYEEKKFPWLVAEKKLIEKAIRHNKVVIGICLGAQLIADVLGAMVQRNAHKEIGWFPVTLTAEASKSSVFGRLSREFMAFHWHGDTFAIPAGAAHIGVSKACFNQAFQYQERVFGLQFHLESSESSIRALVKNCQDELVEEPYVQNPDAILSNLHYISPIRTQLEIMLDGIS